MADLSREQLLDFYRQMCVIRRFEGAVSHLFAQGKVPGSVHLSIGQEGSAVGSCAVLRASDYIVSNHRGHGHVIAKGADPKRAMAEVLGRQTGLCHGKGGSLHMCDMSVGVIGTMGIVAGGIPVATGAALAIKMKKEDQVVMSFLGDGASNEGVFHESLNMASAWSLPIVYVCENNLYGISTFFNNVAANKDVASRAVAYDMPGVVVDGNDVVAVYEAAQEAVARAREGRGPTLLECKTYRWHGHFEGEDVIFEGRSYRSKEEVEQWKAKDPIVVFGRYLCERDIASEEHLAAIDAEVRNLMDGVIKFGLDSPWPEPQEALEALYAD